MGIRYLLSLVLLLLSAVTVLAQTSERAALWDNYQLPEGNFIRYVDTAQGYSLWRPAEWQEHRKESGEVSFIPSTPSSTILVFTETIPEGFGLANYVATTLQQLRKGELRQEQITNRRVTIGGYEGRELAFDLENRQGVTVRETLWITTVGPRAYLFLLVMRPEDQPGSEPFFKRLLLSVHFNEGERANSFEQLRARFVSSSPSTQSDREIVAAKLTEAIRQGSLSTDAIAQQLQQLFQTGPDAALELLLDSSPRVRAAAIHSLTNLRDEHSTAALIWALMDKDAICGMLAARALAARGDTALSIVKEQFFKLVTTPAALVYLGTALDDRRATTLTQELLNRADKQSRLAGLMLAISLPLKDLTIPYQQLLASNDRAIITATLSAIDARNSVDATAALLVQLQSDTAIDIAYVLGEVGSIDALASLQVRLLELDRQLTMSDLKEQQQKDLKRQRREIELSVIKIKIRQQLNNTNTGPARQQIYQQAWQAAQPEIREWLQRQSTKLSLDTIAKDLSAKKFDLPIDPITTGATIFPRNATHYLMTANLAQTLNRLDDAFSGIQMETICDQMFFVLILKKLKAQLLETLQPAESQPMALGIDLTAPLALASWPASANDNHATKLPAHSALIARVTDRERLERLLATYQEQFGNFDRFATLAATSVRLAGLTPAILPIGVAIVSGDSLRNTEKQRADKPLHTTVSLRAEQLGNLSLTRIDRLVIYEKERSEQSAIFLLYLGNSVVIAPSREALIDLLQQQAKLSDSNAYTQVQREQGEIVFFSQPGAIIKENWQPNNDSDRSIEPIINGITELIGVESGALQLTARSFETAFHFSIADNNLAGTLRPFSPSELTAPAQLLPRDMLLYFGAVLDPSQSWALLKNLNGATSEAKSSKDQFDIEFERAVLPQLQGEVAIALLSIKPLFDEKQKNNPDNIPALLCACRLKDDRLAEQLRAGKLFNKRSLVPAITILGSPVFGLKEGNSQFLLTIVNNYLIIADSVPTLQRLETNHHFAETRDYQRSAQAVPNRLALFITYSFDAAFTEASEIIAKDDNAMAITSILSAFLHAFHSQYAYIAFDQAQLAGKIAVSFDREGRYSIGKLAGTTSEIDIANALITPKGLNIVDSTQIESLRLRVKAARPEIIERVRNDVAKFSSQKLDSSNEQEVIFISRARRIAEDQTVTLPITSAEFAPYLRPSARIRSTAPEIVELAKTIVGTDRDGRSVARKLGEWTYKNLKWKKVQSDVVDTLASREADCLEHSELYVALARAVGLPARVVTGAAFASGSFGAHAWVEIYLGRWVEVDPTWGVMDYVDATHLRFDGDTFISYAMLNQLELEILQARRFSRDEQRDPIKLIEQLLKSPPEKHEIYFDLNLTADQLFGNDQFTQFKDKEREDLIYAFERAINYAVKNVFANDISPRLIASEVTSDRAQLLLLNSGDDLWRVWLARRDGVWYITDLEDCDKAIMIISDALQAARTSQPSHRQLYELASSKSSAQALKQIEALINKQGETVPLMLLKTAALRFKFIEEVLEKDNGNLFDLNSNVKDQYFTEMVQQLQLLTKRFPDYPAVYYALADALTYREGMESEYIATLQQYIKLVPQDPRPWQDLAVVYDELKQHTDAEKAYQAAIERDAGSYHRHINLAGCYLHQSQVSAAKASIDTALKLNNNSDEVLSRLANTILDSSSSRVTDYAALEALLLQYPKELADNKDLKRFLMTAQIEQQKYAQALETVTKLMAQEPEAQDYLATATIQRKLRQFSAAIDAATTALEMDEQLADSHFQLACAMAQIGRKKEALTHLQQAVEMDGDYYQKLTEPDLKPISATLEFRKLKKLAKQK